MAKWETWTPIITINILFLTHLVTARSLPPLDLSDELYREINYLLAEHERNSKSNQHPQPIEQSDWPIRSLNIGQAAGIAVDAEGNPVVFHRGINVWDYNSFNDTEYFQHVKKGPIPNDTIVTLDKSTGLILNGWGRDLFYLPHGLTIDKDGNTWVTDVALHQVLKFPAKSSVPSLVLGEAFVPGSDKRHFCKPTDVAVASNGEFFVSDGYCNSRILKYSADGKLQAEWGHSGDHGEFLIAHSLALLEDKDAICVADRENKRIMCYLAGLGNLPPGKLLFNIHGSHLGRVFAITTYDFDKSTYMFAVTGQTAGLDATGVTIRLSMNILMEEIVNTWSPAEGFLQPHDICVSPDGKYLYVAEIGPNRITKFRIRHH